MKNRSVLFRSLILLLAVCLLLSQAALFSQATGKTSDPPKETQIPATTAVPTTKPDVPGPAPTNAPSPVTTDAPMPVPTDKPAPIPVTTDAPMPVPTDTPAPIPVTTDAPVATTAPAPTKKPDVPETTTGYICNHWHEEEADYIDLTPDAKCGDAYRREYVCAFCGESYVEEGVVTHKWGSDTLLNPDARCGELWKYEHTCSICGATETHTVPVEHHMNDGVIVKDAANCKETGKILYTCTKCGKTETVTFPGDHKWKVTSVEIEPAPGEQGYAFCACALCKETSERPIGYPVKSMEITPAAPFYENITGAPYAYQSAYWYGDIYHSYGYFHYTLGPETLKYKVTLKDGTVLDYLPEEYTLTFDDGQSAKSQWKAGSHKVKAQLSSLGEDMCETTFTVELLPCPIQSVTAEFVGDVPGDLADSLRYYGSIPAALEPTFAMRQESSEKGLLLHTRLSVTFSDGTSEQVFASALHPDTFEAKSIKETKDGFAVEATWCNFPLSYTVNVKKAGTLPKNKATTAEKGIDVNWKNVAYPKDLGSVRRITDQATDGKRAAFLYRAENTGERKLAVFETDKTFRTVSADRLLQKYFGSDFETDGVWLSYVKGRFFLCADDCRALTTVDLKNFSVVNLPDLGTDQWQISECRGEYLLTVKGGAAVGEGIAYYYAFSPNLKTWTDVRPINLPVSDAWTSLDLLCTTPRGAMFALNRYTEGTATPYQDGVYYTEDFETFVPAAPGTTPADQVCYMGAQNQRGLINLFAVERLFAFRPDDDPGSAHYLSVRFLQFDEKKLKTVEKAAYTGTFSDWWVSGNNLLYLMQETKNGTAVRVFTESGRPVNEASLPFSLHSVADMRAFTFTEDDGRVYASHFISLEDSGEMLFTEDGYQTILHISAPDPETNAGKGDEEAPARSIFWTRDNVLLLTADRLCYFDSNDLSPYLKTDRSEKLREFPGDVDGDGAITAGDARATLRAAVGLEALKPDTAAFINADANGDGKLLAEDARLVLRAAVGLEELS